jgi:hypothetical protein
MANPQDFVSWGTVSRTKPQLQPPTTKMPFRVAQDGVQAVQSLVPTKQVLADEGSYFVSTNPTPSSGLAYGSAGTQATFVDTVPFMQIINTGNPGDPNAPIVFPDYIKLLQIGGTAPASTTSIGVAMKLDNGFRTASAGTPATVVPVSSNMNLATAQPAHRLVYFTGAVATIPAASSAARLCARGMIKGGPTLLLDEYTMAFGLNDPPTQGGYLTTVAAYTTRVPPVAIGPGQSLTVYLWFIGGATNPFTYEFEATAWER